MPTKPDITVFRNDDNKVNARTCYEIDYDWQNAIIISV